MMNNWPIAIPSLFITEQLLGLKTLPPPHSCTSTRRTTAERWGMKRLAVVSFPIANSPRSSSKSLWMRHLYPTFAMDLINSFRRALFPATQPLKIISTTGLSPLHFRLLPHADPPAVARGALIFPRNSHRNSGSGLLRLSIKLDICFSKLWCFEPNYHVCQSNVNKILHVWIPRISCFLEFRVLRHMLT